MKKNYLTTNDYLTMNDEMVCKMFSKIVNERGNVNCCGLNDTTIDCAKIILSNFGYLGFKINEIPVIEKNWIVISTIKYDGSMAFDVEFSLRIENGKLTYSINVIGEYENGCLHQYYVYKNIKNGEIDILNETGVNGMFKQENVINNKLYNFINREIETTNNINCFVVIHNPLSKITHWGKFGYDVTYDCIHFDNMENMNEFINGNATYDYIDNSCKLHDGETVLFTYINRVNKYINLKNIISALYNDFLIEYGLHYDEFKRYEFKPLLLNLHDGIVDFIYEFLFKNNRLISLNMINKFTEFNKKCFDETISKYLYDFYF